MRIALPESPAAARNFPEGFYSRFTPMAWTKADGYWKIALRKSSPFSGARWYIRLTEDKKEIRFELAVNWRR
jgi:hypothetical protein